MTDISSFEQKAESETPLSVNQTKDKDHVTRFYTGLPSFADFLWLYK